MLNIKWIFVFKNYFLKSKEVWFFKKYIDVKILGCGNVIFLFLEIFFELFFWEWIFFLVLGAYVVFVGSVCFFL